MHSVAMIALLGLECFVVLFVALHNWIPLGRLNDVKGARREFPTVKLLLTTSTNFIPAAVGLAATIYYFGRGFPGWVFWFLWIFYGLACVGSFSAWWRPYLFGSNAEQVAKYQTMYANTHSILPLRHGLRPNTLHVVFDVVTVAILVDLAVLTL